MGLKSGLLTAAGLWAIACANQASAQSAGARGADAANATNSDIVVTASRTKEPLRKAPLAVTVQTQEELSKAGATNIQTLASTVPNLHIATQGFNGATLITLRGVSNSDPNAEGNPAVSTYIDGIYVGYTTGLVGAFYDLDRLEVLRGPQGTLYGRNSTGGNVNLYTADPQKDFHASADLSYGSYNDVQARAVINVPVTDTLSVRFAGIVHRNDGYINTNGVTSRNYGKADDFGGRITALWQPTDKITWRISADAFKSNGTPTLVTRIGPNGDFLTPGAPYHPVIGAFPEPVNKNVNVMVRSRLEYDFGSGLKLSYLAGYQYSKDEIQFGWYGARGILESSGLNKLNFHDLSNEITLNYENGPIKNIIGASVFTKLVQSSAVYGIAVTNALFGVEEGGGYSSNAKGIFDQLTVEIRPGLRLLGGLRYSHESQNQKDSNFVFCSPVAPFIGTNYANLIKNLPALATNPTCFVFPTGVGSGVWNNLSWKGGVTFDLSNNVSGYATATSGFKSGGFNPGSTVNYLPETIINYEAGLKFKALNGRLSLNTAAFLANYTNLQVFQEIPIIGGTTLSQEIVNAAAAQIKGIEAEAAFNISPNDRISGFVTYLDARYKNYKNANDPLDGTQFANLSGNRLPNAPKWSARITYAHDFNLANGGVLTPTIVAYWRDSTFLRQFNRPIDYVKGFTKTDLDLSYVSPKKNWSVSAYVHNLEGNIRRNTAYVDIGVYQSDVNPPRTFGVRVGVKY